MRNINLNSVGFFQRITSTAQILMTLPSIGLSQFLNNGTIDGDVEVFSIPGIDEVHVEGNDGVVVSREVVVGLGSRGLVTESSETTEERVFTAGRSNNVVGVTLNSPTSSRVEAYLIEFSTDEGLTFFNVRSNR